YTINWNGDWGAALVKLDIAANEWTRRNLGQKTATAPYDDDLRNAYASHAQSALDSDGQMLYSMTLKNRLFRIKLGDPNHMGEWVGDAPKECILLDDSAQELYMVFDPDHRAILRICVPNTGGEVLGIAAYFVDQNKWEWYAAPVDRPNAVI